MLRQLHRPRNGVGNYVHLRIDDGQHQWLCRLFHRKPEIGQRPHDTRVCAGARDGASEATKERGRAARLALTPKPRGGIDGAWLYPGVDDRGGLGVPQPQIAKTLESRARDPAGRIGHNLGGAVGSLGYAHQRAGRPGRRLAHEVLGRPSHGLKDIHMQTANSCDRIAHEDPWRDAITDDGCGASRNPPMTIGCTYGYPKRRALRQQREQEHVGRKGRCAHAMTQNERSSPTLKKPTGEARRKGKQGAWYRQGPAAIEDHQTRLHIARIDQACSVRVSSRIERLAETACCPVAGKGRLIARVVQTTRTQIHERAEPGIRGPSMAL